MSLLTLYRSLADPNIIDAYPGATAAYSLRALVSGNPTVVRVRRSSDNAEANFTATEVSDGTLVTWVGTTASDDGHVVTWVDQSGNGNDATQATAADQPLIVDGGVLVTDDNKPAISFPTIGMLLSGIPSPDPSNVFIVTNNKTDNNFIVLPTSDFTYYALAANDGNASTVLNQFGAGISKTYTIYIDGLEFSGTTRDDLYEALSGRKITYINITDDMPNFQIGYYANIAPALSFEGVFQELIIYPSDQSANRSAIEQNIADYYGITLA